MKHYKHNLSHFHLTSFDMGELIPIGCIEVLPGDIFKHDVRSLLRVTPQIKPVMHPVDVQVVSAFVPFRILWDGWEDFITGESATPPPTISGGAHLEGKLYDYMGAYNDPSNDMFALYIRAYNAIYNYFFRDKDLIPTEVNEDSVDVQKVSWRKDYFTAARPSPQRGDAVTLPLGTTAPVLGIGFGTSFTAQNTNANVNEIGGVADTYAKSGHSMDANPNIFYIEEDPSNAGSPYLRADLQNAAGIDLIAFREALALQSYREARSRYGHDYAELLRSLGITPSDGRLQAPELLGSYKSTIAFSEVLNTASNGGTDALGDFGGHGINASRTPRYTKFFQEHGVVLTLMYVRPKAIYMNGLHRRWSRTSVEDFWTPQFERIGMQEVLNKEIYAAHSSPDGVFGYSPRYDEYRTMPSYVSAEFRNSKSYDWHFGRLFTSDPALNPSFIECDPDKRPFAEQTNDALWVMVWHNLKTLRLIGKRKAPITR